MKNPQLLGQAFLALFGPMLSPSWTEVETEKSGTTTYAVEAGLLTPAIVKEGVYTVEGAAYSGNVVSFYSNGQKAAIGMTQSGRPTGNWKTFYESGTLEKEGTFCSATPCGEWDYYYRSGRLFRKTNFSSNGDAESVAFGEYGEIKEEASFHNGSFCCTRIERYPDGKIAKLITYTGNEVSRIRTFWAFTGNRQVEKDYSSGEAGHFYMTAFREYHPNGGIKYDKQISYFNGTPFIKRQRTFRADGTLVSDQTFGHDGVPTN